MSLLLTNCRTEEEKLQEKNKIGASLTTSPASLLLAGVMATWIWLFLNTHTVWNCYLIWNADLQSSNSEADGRLYFLIFGLFDEVAAFSFDS